MPNANRFVEEIFAAQTMVADSGIVWVNTRGNTKNTVSLKWTGTGSPIGNFVIYHSPDGTTTNAITLSTTAAGGTSGSLSSTLSKAYEYVGLGYTFTSDGIGATFTAFIQGGESA